MEFRKVTAIIRSSVLEKVEERLKELGVKGISVTRVMGYGEYTNFLNPDWMVDRARIEIFTSQAQSEQIVAAILESAHVGLPGDGIVAVLPVEKLFRIRSKTEIAPDEV